MKVLQFQNPKIYSSRMYLVLGTWNKIDDVNTVIDVGTNDYILEAVRGKSTGVGKRPIEQVILTHEHFDHTSGLTAVINRFHPEVISYANVTGRTRNAFDGMEVKIADTYGQILYTPGHSNDSICIYLPEEKALFSGDTPLDIKSPGGSYQQCYVDVLRRLSRLDIDIIYPGHDDPITKSTHTILMNTLRNVLNSKIIT